MTAPTTVAELTDDPFDDPAQPTPQEVAKERASFLLDLVIASPEAYSYAACRQELAELYTEAEDASLAAFVCPEAKP